MATKEDLYKLVDELSDAEIETVHDYLLQVRNEVAHFSHATDRPMSREMPRALVEHITGIDMGGSELPKTDNDTLDRYFGVMKQRIDGVAWQRRIRAEWD